MLIPDADRALALKVMRCLGRTGRFEVVAASPDAANPIRWSRYCSRLDHGPKVADSTWIDWVVSWGLKEPGTVLLPVTKEGFWAVSSARTRLSEAFTVVRLPSTRSLEIAADKLALADLAACHGIPSLPSFPATRATLEMIAAGSFSIPPPILLKSRAQAGGSGFTKLTSRSEVAEFLASGAHVDDSQALIQPLVDGVDYSLSVFCRHGEVLSYTLWRALEYGSREFSIPTVLEFVENASITSAGRRLIEVLQWDGVCDIDFFMGRDGQLFWLLELNPRFWQTLPAGVAAGVNFPELCCLEAIDQLPGRLPLQDISVLYARPSGVLRLWKHVPITAITWRRLVANTGLSDLLRDPLPELSGARNTRP